MQVIGAYAVSYYEFSNATTISVLVGGQGTSPGSESGGGGTFCASGNTPICVAGGGGGADITNSNLPDVGTRLQNTYCNGQSTQVGGSSNSSRKGTIGYGGPNYDSNNSGAGGGGFYGDGSAGNNNNNGGKAFLNGGTGGTGKNGYAGGFGGGGASYSAGQGSETAGGGAGGGGYTGGTGGDNNWNYGGGRWFLLFEQWNKLWFCNCRISKHAST